MRRSSLALACALGLHSAGAACAAQIPELVEEERVERAILPIRVEPADCSAAVLAQLVVTEDGRPCAAATVQADAPPRLHALLIDNSATMGPFIATVRSAAAEYLERIPREELALVATFADNLILRAPLSGDRAGQLRAVAQIPLGFRTALIDALYATLLYLEPRRERKVVVLFTDGADNASLAQSAGPELLRLAETAGVRVFTIHLGGRGGEEPDSVELLRRMSAATGAYFEAPTAAAIQKAYRAIGESLASERSLVYEPPPSAAGAASWHEVRAEVPRGAGCRVELPIPRRFDGAAAPRSASEPEVFTLPQRAPLPTVLGEFCEVGRSCWRPTEVLTFPAAALLPQQPSEPPRFTLLAPPWHLAGHALDVTGERGALYDATVLGDHGRYLLHEDAAARIEARDFVMVLPDLDEVRRQFHSAVDVLERWMLRGGGGPSAFVQGQTWLELRPWLARSLYRSRTDYSQWADEKLTLAHADYVERLLALHTKDHIERQRLRPLLLAHVERPGQSQLPGVIAEWLGDVSAREVALGLEARVADRLLRLGEAERKEERERFESFWPRMRGWLGPPTRVRLVVPLFPLYDARRDVVGFQRIVLPQPLPSGAPPADAVPDVPFGVRIVGRLLADRRFAAEFAPAVKVAGIEHRPVFLSLPSEDEPDAPPGAPPAPPPPPGLPPYTAFESVLRLASAEGEVALASYLVGQVPEGFDLRCMAVQGKGKGPPLAAWLREYIAASGVACERNMSVLPVIDPGP